MSRELLQMAFDALEHHTVQTRPIHNTELAIDALRAALAQPQAEPVDNDDVLWLWKNGDHMLAFRHLYPCYSPGGDPMTLGEPCGKAIFRHSHDRACAAPAAPEQFVGEYVFNDVGGIVKKAAAPAPDMSCPECRSDAVVWECVACSATNYPPAAPAVPAWLPIESAPRDNTEILLSNGADVSSGAWFEAGRETHDSDGAPNDDYHEAQFLDWGGGMLPEPTHWMPLPAAPGSAPAVPAVTSMDYGMFTDEQTNPAAPAAQPLTEPEIFKAYTTATGKVLLNMGLSRSELVALTRIVERAHGITGDSK